MPVIKNRRRDENGAFAVVYAILVLVLFGIAALGTDLGNGISRRTSVQGQADFAAYDAGQKLTASVRPASTIPSAVIDQVRDSLNNNQPQNDGDPCDTTTPVTCVTSSMLTDGNLQNGEVRVTSLGLQVVAPRTYVDFGLAGFVNRSGAEVTADATVNVFSPGRGVFPMFAVSGCDAGRQTLTDPANGQTTGTPTLAFGSPYSSADLITPLTMYNSSNVQVATVPVNGSGYQIHLSASDWDKTWKVGFFKADGSVPDSTQVLEGAALRNAATHVSFPTTAPISNTLQQIEVTIPSSVASVEGVWYVRVWGGRDTIGAAQNRWSEQATAVPLRIGQSLLECAAGSNDGNFGTLSIPRNDSTPSNEIALNIAKGLQDPPNLAVHAWGRARWLANDLTWNGECVDGQNLAVVSSGANDREADTNCVGTDPGLAANVATSGFVTGVTAGNTVLAPGLLIAPTVCDRNGGTSTRSVSIGNTSYQLNDDVLSCFLKDGKSLADISDLSYSGPAALTADVLKSPRFGFVPVVSEQPGNGASNTYSIVDFRPAFITDETATASAVKGSQTGTANNGLTFSNNGLTQIKVVFFDIDALPSDGDIPLQDYLGVGKPIVHLVD